jgi:hypothetical protein
MMIQKSVALLKRTKFSSVCTFDLFVVASSDSLLASRFPLLGVHRSLAGQETIGYWAAALFLFEQTPSLPEAILISLPVRE